MLENEDGTVYEPEGVVGSESETRRGATQTHYGILYTEKVFDYCNLGNCVIFINKKIHENLCQLNLDLAKFLRILYSNS